MILRSYQRDVCAGAVDLWRQGFRRIAAVVATGGGKTVIFSHTAEMCLAAGVPVLVLAHRTELIDQAIEKMEKVAPHRRVGRLQGRVKEYRAEVVVGSIQTAGTKATLALLKLRRWGLIIIDETHHAAADSYVRVLRELGAYDGDGPLVLGVTATLDRSDGRALSEIFEAIVEPRVGLVDLIRHPEGPFLVPPRGVRVRIAELDLARVKRVAGDFNSGALGAAMSAAMAPQKIVEAWQKHSPDESTIAFLPTVAVSIETARAFNEAGVSAIHLDGTTPEGDKRNPAPGTRRWALAEYTAGRILVLCNVGLFTEGTDLPRTKCVVLGRPTSSSTLYQQMVGRGLRLFEGKEFCWILDVTGVTGRHKLATLASLDGAPSPDETPDDLLMYEDDGDPDETYDHDLEEPEPIPYADGDLAHELVDLFGESQVNWLLTTGGTWFVPAGNAGFVYLAPSQERGRFDLRYYSNGRTSKQGHGTLREALSVSEAMFAGDQYVSANPMWMTERGAKWRSEIMRGGRVRGEWWDDKMIVEASRVL